MNFNLERFVKKFEKLEVSMNRNEENNSSKERFSDKNATDQRSF